MQRKFNVTGTCIPKMHYLVDISGKIKQIIRLIENGEYFTINRPRQFGKTTTFSHLEKILCEKSGYLVSSISFEGVDDERFNDTKSFSPWALNKICECIYNQPKLQKELCKLSEKVHNLDTLSSAISSFVKKHNKKFILLIDEVDKSSNNQLFLSFLGMLRNKYLLRNDDKDYTFQSVILASVHDVKTLKLKLRPGDEQKYNSPWNIATDFKVDMSFNPAEIATMLLDYANDKKVEMDIPQISQRIYHYTSGYPFLVSRICKEIDEEIFPLSSKNNWTVNDVDNAVKVITMESNTNFKSIAKNIENDEALYNFITDLILGSTEFSFVEDAPLIEKALTHGLIRNVKGKVQIHNKIYEEYLSNYIVARLSTEGKLFISHTHIVQTSYLKPDGRLNFEKVLLKFQEIIKEKYSKSDVLKSDEFLEKDLRLLFLVFLKPIINGVGFSFKEVETSEEKRLDIVVIFRDEKFVVELKLWRGIKYHRQGITRLKDYMKREGVNKGYMLIMDKKRSKKFVTYREKGMGMVWL